MFWCFLIVVIIIIFLLLAVIALSAFWVYISDRAFISSFLIGIWVNDTQDVLVFMKSDNGVEMSVGVNQGDEYEMTSREYEYTTHKHFGRQTYDVHFTGEKIWMVVDTVAGTATMYVGDEVSGVFAKTNMVNLPDTALDGDGGTSS